jgi:hypothetical protein
VVDPPRGRVLGRLELGKIQAGMTFNPFRVVRVEIRTSPSPTR